jgi:methyl-accepting chemotaxis protein
MIAFAVMLGATLLSLQIVRVNGPLYAKIVLGKDLVADILPPPEYVIEGYLEATLAVRDPASAEARATRIAVLEADYNARQAFWRASSLAPELKAQILGDTAGPAQAFWSELRTGLFPALERGDAAAANASYARASAEYTRHRAAIDRLVADTNADNRRWETFGGIILAAAAALLLAIAAGAVLAVRRRAARIAQNVVDPLAELTEVMAALSSGDQAKGIPHAARTDEVGEIARALVVFRDQGREGDRLRADQEAASLYAQAERGKAEQLREQALRRMAEQVERETRDAVQTVANAMHVVADKADEMAAAARAVDEGSDAVSAAASESVGRTRTVAATAKAFDATARRIGDQAGQARDAAGQVVAAVRETQTILSSLSEAAGQIGQVTDLIADIARQTNLLALNASVEAARAGPAGLGFAVVAGEVKALAGQTARATDDIRALIAGVQESAANTVSSVDGITGLVNNVDAASVAIAEVVGEQGVATRSMAETLGDAAAMAETMEARMRQVSGQARAAGQASLEVLDLAARVTGDIGALSETLVRVVRTSTSEVERRRRPRHAVDLGLEVIVGGHRQSAQLHNLSAGGAMLSGFDASQGQHLKVCLPGLTTPATGAVLGIKGGIVHVKFDAVEPMAADIERAVAKIVTRSPAVRAA